MILKFLLFFVVTFSILISIVLAETIIIDDLDSGYSETGTWSSFSNACGFNGDYRYETNVALQNAAWLPAINSTKNYTVYVHYCVHSARPVAVPYTIVHADGTDIVNVNQTTDANGNVVSDLSPSGWKRLGRFRFTSLGGQYVELDTSNSGDTSADAVNFTTDIYVPGDYSTIQDAIDAADSGDTIFVGPGIYNEQLTIDKSLTFIGDPGSSPGPGPNAPVIDGNGVVGSAITIDAGVSNVTINGFEIRNYSNRPTGNPFTTGGIGSAVLAWNTGTFNITVKNNYMHDLGWNAILVGNEGQGLHDNWFVEDNIVNNSAFYGIELTNTKNSRAINNIITGGANVINSGDSSQDAILIQTQIHTGGGLTVSSNLIDNNIINGTLTRAGIEFLAWDSTSSLNAKLDNLTASNNMVTGSIRGFYIFSVGANANISNFNIISNTINRNQDGMQLRDILGGKHESINIIGNNIINSTGNSSGVNIRSGTSAAGIIVAFNNITGNSFFGINNSGTGTLNAENNWWGSTNGPTHPSNLFNVGNQGDNVTDNVDFIPWLGAPYPAGVSFSPVANNENESYSSIQAAINGTSPYGVINVSIGTYKENLVVNKPLLLVGLSKLATIIDADPPGLSGITITSNNVVVSQFKVVNSSGDAIAGIKINNSDNVTVRSCVATENEIGIYISDGSENNTIENCWIFSNINYGINVVGDNNVIKENRIENNSETNTGVNLTSLSSNNSLFGNIFLYNDGQAVDNGANNTWNNTDKGNFWSDFRNNSGYPTSYLIPGAAGSKDLKPMSFLARIITRAQGNAINKLQNYTSVNISSSRNTFFTSLSESNGILSGSIVLSLYSTTTDGTRISTSLIIYPSAVVSINESAFSFLGTGKLSISINKRGMKTIRQTLNLDQVTVDGNKTSINIVGKMNNVTVVDVSNMIPSSFLTKFDTRIRI